MDFIVRSQIEQKVYLDEKIPISSFMLFTGSCFQDGIHFFVDVPVATVDNVPYMTAYLCQGYCQNYAGCVRFAFSKTTKFCYLSRDYGGTVYVAAQYTSGPKYCAGPIFYRPLLMLAIVLRLFHLQLASCQIK